MYGLDSIVTMFITVEEKMETVVVVQMSNDVLSQASDSWPA